LADCLTSFPVQIICQFKCTGLMTYQHSVWLNIINETLWSLKHTAACEMLLKLNDA